MRASLNEKLADFYAMEVLSFLILFDVFFLYTKSFSFFF